MGLSSSLTLPSTNYYTDGVFTIGSFYRWVEIVESELVFVPASFHVGSSWVAFGRNQAIVTSNDIGYATNSDIINTANVHNYEYNQGFKMSMRPSAFAKSRSVPSILKSGVITNPDDF